MIKRMPPERDRWLAVGGAVASLGIIIAVALVSRAAERDREPAPLVPGPGLAVVTLADGRTCPLHSPRFEYRYRRKKKDVHTKHYVVVRFGETTSTAEDEVLRVYDQRSDRLTLRLDELERIEWDLTPHPTQSTHMSVQGIRIDARGRTFEWSPLKVNSSYRYRLIKPYGSHYWPKVRRSFLRIPGVSVRLVGESGDGCGASLALDLTTDRHWQEDGAAVPQRVDFVP